MTTENEIKQTPSSYGFSTLKGVYIPSVLTIFGVIMYLRMGWMVGNVGIFGSIIIVTLSSLITFLTGISIAATATNMKVRGGGAYYMISRSFGVEAGAAIGVPLFLAQSIGMAFYVTGFSESVHSIIPQIPQVAVSIGGLVLITFLAYRSTDIALRTQSFILGIIILSLISFFLGSPVNPADSVQNAEISSVSFWAVFAVFFPAVTGIEAGLSMSGDLKNPSRSLPLGTLGAIITGYIVYIAIPIFLAHQAPTENLRADPLIMQKIALFGPLIFIGLWGSSLSSALGAILGAPRTLQALARDRLVLGFLGKGHGPTDAPRIATIVSFCIALGAVLLGDLNAIATILTMFFLTSYGFLNLAAGLEGLMGNPSWRPKFRAPWTLSIIGALGCLATMLMIDPGATIIATVCVVGLFFLTKRRRLGSHWTDIRRGILMTIAQKSIYELSKSEPDARSWRPNMLVLSGSPSTRWHLIEFADAISHGKGFLTVAAILEQDSVKTERSTQMEKSIRDFLWSRGVRALVEVRSHKNKLEGAQTLIASHGMGPLKPNTIVLGDTEVESSFESYANLIRYIYLANRNLVILRKTFEEGDKENPISPKKSIDPPVIDVWWGRERQNANLMLALAYLQQINPKWQGARVRLNTTIIKEEDRLRATEVLQKFVAEGRLPIEPHVFKVSSGEEVFQLITSASAESDLVFVGMRPPDPDESTEAYCEYYRNLLEKTKDLPLTAIVMASEKISFSEIFV